MSSRVTRTSRAAAVAVLSLVFAQVALAENPVSRFTAADQAAARAAVLNASDLGAGMTGGVEKNAKAASSSDRCPGLWEPRQSDLVITGVARSDFTGVGVKISSMVQVYKTERMARLDWERTVVHPGVVPCGKKILVGEATPTFKVISVKRTAFPRIGRAAARIRVIADVKPAADGKPIRIMIDQIAFGRGRTGISLTLTARYTDPVSADAVEVRLARALAGRIRV